MLFYTIAYISDIVNIFISIFHLLLASKKHIKEPDLNNVPLLLTSHGCNFRAMLIETLVKSSITPKIILETESKGILKQFAINQLGVAFMPDMVVQEEIKNHSLKKLDWNGGDFPIFSQVFIHKDKHLNKATRNLLKQYQTVMSRTCRAK